MFQGHMQGPVAMCHLPRLLGWYLGTGGRHFVFSCVFPTLVLCAILMASCGQPKTSSTDVTTVAATQSPALTTMPTPTIFDAIVQIEFPTWVDESPEMARIIATSEVIAKTRFVSIDSTIRKHDNYGYEVELIYKFEVVQYLRGNGADQLEARLSSGPKYIAFPDWLDERTKSEAQQLATSWLAGSRARVGNARNGILFLDQSSPREDYRFTSTKGGLRRGDYPVLGETWLIENEDSIYRHQFTDKKSATISFLDLNTRIQELASLMDGEYAECIDGTLSRRNRVREQILGTYQELTLGGYSEPTAFPRHKTEFVPEESWFVLGFRRPPYQTPRFSDYWLDGKDSDLFALSNRADTTYTFEGFTEARALPHGEYSVHYSQYHNSLPCDRRFPVFDDAWRSADTTEWIVEIPVQKNVTLEAFFDPVDHGASVGAYASDGNISPDSFLVTPFTPATIAGLDWADGTVTMKLETAIVPLGQQVEFIDPSRNVLLRLSFDDADVAEEFEQKILRWGVCDQPWIDGDKLMLRVTWVGPNWDNGTNDSGC